ncbi:hypothetical protein BDW69DRAFT_164226 [Aspergillus filifer]
MQALQQYGHDDSSSQPNDSGNNAYTITWTFQDGNLGLWAHHPIRSTNPDRQSDFVMTAGSSCLSQCPRLCRRT